jgi:hypothetical protein
MTTEGHGASSCLHGGVGNGLVWRTCLIGFAALTLNWLPISGSTIAQLHIQGSDVSCIGCSVVSVEGRPVMLVPVPSWGKLQPRPTSIHSATAP